MGDLTAAHARLSADLGVRWRGTDGFCGYSLTEKIGLVIGPRGEPGRCEPFSGGRTVTGAAGRGYYGGAPGGAPYCGKKRRQGG